MTRHFWVLIHRYVGLAMTVFLIIVGLTGSVLAFQDELDLWLNPDLLRVEVRDAPLLDPLVLREKAEALASPRYRVDSTPLAVEPGRSYEASLSAHPGTVAPDQEIVPLFGHEYLHLSDPIRPRWLYLDPYTGEKLGERHWGDISLQRKDFMSLVYRLHMTLGLPRGYIGLGGRILGITALLWTLDCFVGFYLTLPKRKKRNVVPDSASHSGIPSGAQVDCRNDGFKGKSFWQRWQLAWKVKFSAGATRINFDIHRAFGLWTWFMLFILAWSSVAFNLEEVYNPVMYKLFGAPPEPEHQAVAKTELPTRPPLTGEPKQGWYQAREVGRKLVAEKAHKEGFVVRQDILLILGRDTGQYTLCTDTQAKGEASQVCGNFDADTGLSIPESPVSTSASEQDGLLSDTITWWITNLHLAAIFGLPMKIIICLMGLVITALSVTGVVIWWKKCRAAKAKQIKMASGVNIPELNN